MNEHTYITLSEWAVTHGVTYKASWYWHQAGRLPGSRVTEKGTIEVPLENQPPELKKPGRKKKQATAH